MLVLVDPVAKVSGSEAKESCVPTSAVDKASSWKPKRAMAREMAIALPDSTRLSIKEGEGILDFTVPAFYLIP